MVITITEKITEYRVSPKIVRINTMDIRLLLPTL